MSPTPGVTVHIPDGYLSPQTCIAAYAIAVPALGVAARRVDAVARTRNVPLLAMSAGVSFLVMMLNVPIPGGTTAHAVGAAVIAIALGPWAAMLAVAVALLFQALLFGDGGVLAYGANVVNLAIVLPVVAWAVYRVVAGRSALDSRRRLIAAALAGYVGITAAGLATGFELGLQPLLFHDAAGTPLYSPYPMGQALAAMALAHLTVAGAAEAILTAAVFGYLVRADPQRLRATHPSLLTPAGAPAPTAASMPPARRLTPARVAVLAVAGLAVLTPLGLLAPGGAFAEEAPEELDLGSLGLQAIPEGMARYTGFWRHSLLGDYGFADGQSPVLAYWLSALVGLLVVGGVVYVGGLLASRWSRRAAGDRAGGARAGERAAGHCASGDRTADERAGSLRDDQTPAPSGRDLRT